MGQLQVVIITGSDSDLPAVAGAVKVLEDFNITYAIRVASAHRTPEHVRTIVRDAEKKGAQVIIAAAGMSAALPGVVAAETVLPVIGVPMEGRSLAGMDSLFAIAQMPPAIPVACVAIGKAGATNAAILAVEILALKSPARKAQLLHYRKKLSHTVIDKDTALQKVGLKKYLESMQK